MTDIKQQGDLYIIDDANNTLTVDSANTRVGIGNNNPGHSLSVTGDGNFTANLSAGSNLFLVDAGNSRITLGTTTAVSGNVLTIVGDTDLAGTLNTTTLQLGGVTLTATATELNQLSGITLGTAASADIGDFATAAQGALADTALQIVAVDGVTITGDGTPGNPLVAAGGGGGGISIGDAVGSGTSGSILFIDSSTQLAQDNGQLFWDNSNNRLGIGTASPSTDLHVEKSGTAIGLIKSTGSHANIRIDRASTSFDSAVLFYTGGSLGWRIQESSGGGDLYFIDQDGSPDTARMRFYDTGLTEISQGLTVGGTITQGNSTNAVLVSDGSGAIASASNLQDVAYSDGQYVDNTGMLPLTPPAPSAWDLGMPPPATFQEAIDRLAAALYNISGPIP